MASHFLGAAIGDFDFLNSPAVWQGKHPGPKQQMTSLVDYIMTCIDAVCHSHFHCLPDFSPFQYQYRYQYDSSSQAKDPA